MIQKISDAGLTAPIKIEDIPLFLKNLSKKEEGIKSGEIPIETKKEETKTVTEEKKEKNEIIVETSKETKVEEQKVEK